MIKSKEVTLGEWDAQLIVDADGHLNIYIKNSDGSEIFLIEGGEGDGINGEALAVRFTTADIEKNSNPPIAGFHFVNPGGDDMCDMCMSSGVNANRTTYCGKTIGVECGCDETYADGTCGDDDCEDCKRGKKQKTNPLIDSHNEMQFKGSALMRSIRPGDRVTILRYAGGGSKHPEYKPATGRAVMRGPHGWVLNMGGKHGTPDIATDENIVKVSGGRR